MITTLDQPKKKLNLPITIGFIALHLGALAAPLTFSWPAFWVFLFLYWLTMGVGIGLCYHRLLTHRSYKCPKWLEYLTTVCACLASEGGPISWVATHRYHHITSDTEKDPHTPWHGFGFNWAHMFWFLYRSPIDREEFRAKYAPDLYKDPGHQFLTKYNWVGPWILGGILFLIGGLPFVIWGIFLRSVAVLHGTWLVNSATHLWGYKTYDAKDNSKNLWWVGLLVFGEGWHNNHHAFQHSARHGLRWWELDMTYLMIRTLGFLGLAWDIRLPNRTIAQAA